MLVAILHIYIYIYHQWCVCVRVHVCVCVSPVVHFGFLLHESCCSMTASYAAMISTGSHGRSPHRSLSAYQVFWEGQCCTTKKSIGWSHGWRQGHFRNTMHCWWHYWFIFIHTYFLFAALVVQTCLFGIFAFFHLQYQSIDLECSEMAKRQS